MLNYFASPLKCFTNSDKFLDFPHETQNDRKYDYFSSQVSRELKIVKIQVTKKMKNLK